MRAAIAKANAAGRNPAAVWTLADQPDLVVLQAGLAEYAAKASALHLVGLDRWLATEPNPILEDQPVQPSPILQRLNYRRESIAATTRLPLVMWLAPGQVSHLAEQAPDLWAWRAAVLDFTLAPVAPPEFERQSSRERSAVDAATARDRLAQIDAYLLDAPAIGSTADLLLEAATIHDALSEFDAAHERAETALERYRALDNPRGVAAALGVIADGLETQGRIGEALRIRTEEQIPVLLRLGDKQAEGKALNKLGKTYAALGDFAHARDCHDQALSIARADGDHLGEADMLLAIGRLAPRTADLPAARDAYQQALSLYRTDNVQLGEANTLKAIGDLAQRTDDLAAARDAYQQALSLYRAINARLGEANTLQTIGDLSQRGDLPAARDAYQQALPLFRAINARLGEANTLQGQGLLHMREGDAAAAFRSFVELSATFQSIGDRLGIQAAFGNMARAAAALGQIDRALLLAGESLALGRAANDRFGQSITLKLLVRLLQDAGDAAGWPAALMLYRELLAGMGDMRTLAQTDALWQHVAQQLSAAELERLRTQAPALLEIALAAARERFGGGDPTRLD